MGNCNIVEEVKSKDVNSKQGNKDNKYKKLLHEEIEEKFRDMTEMFFINNYRKKYVGEGIRKMKAYRCDLKIDELQKLRDEFWTSRIQRNSIYKVIRQATLMDEIRAKNLLAANLLTPVNGCLNLIQDSNQRVYKIPNFCINDPYFEKKISSHTNEGEEEKEIDIFLYDLYENKKIKLKVKNYMKGSELKKLFIDTSQINIEDYRLKFIFGGSEIKDEHYLYQHGIKEDYTVQILKVKIANS